MQCGKREVKDTGKSSLAGKQSTCNSRKSLRAYKVISNSHEAAQLTAPLVLQDKKAVMAVSVGVDMLEGKGGECAVAPASLLRAQQSTKQLFLHHFSWVNTQKGAWKIMSALLIPLNLHPNI